MQISGQGNVDHLAKLLLGVQGTESRRGYQSHAHPVAGQDAVQISSRAKELQRIQALANEPDQARAERVEQIRQSIDSGTYDVSGRKVGDAVIRQVLTDAIL